LCDGGNNENPTVHGCNLTPPPEYTAQDVVELIADLTFLESSHVTVMPDHFIIPD
jgi:hypothetical protein